MTWELDWTGQLIISGDGVMTGGTDWGTAGREATSIRIGEKITSIPEAAFRGLDSVEKILFMGAAPEIAADAFADISADVWHSDQADWTREDEASYGGSLTWAAWTALGSTGDEGAAGGAHWILEPDGRLTVYGRGSLLTGNGDCWYDSQELRTAIRTAVIEPGITGMGDYIFFGCSNMTDITLPAGMTSIGIDVFYGCASLKELELPEGLTSLTSALFYGSGLESLSIPASCTEIDPGVIRGASALQYLSVAAGNPAWQSIDNCLYNKAGTLLSYVPESQITDGSFTVADGVTRIGENVFSGMTSLHTILLPDTLLEIDCGVFENADRLVSVEGGSGLRFIRDRAFYGCTSLESMPLCENLQQIEGNAFYGCSSLKKMIFPEGLTEIGNSAFAECSALQEALLPESLSVLENQVFLNCSSLRAVSLPAGLARMGYGVFDGCTALADMRMPESFTELTELNYETFRQCSSLTEITIPFGITLIGDEAFSGCALAEITIPSGVTRIGSAAFSGCPLTEVTIPATVTTILDSFKGCTELVSFIVDPENTVYSSGGPVLYDRSGSKLLQVGGGISGVYTIPEQITELSASLQAVVVIPEGVTTLWPYCLNQEPAADRSASDTYGNGFINTTMTVLVIPSTVTSIPDNCFFDCPNLRTAYIPATVTSIGYFGKSVGWYQPSHIGEDGEEAVNQTMEIIGKYSSDAYFYCGSMNPNITFKVGSYIGPVELSEENTQVVFPQTYYTYTGDPILPSFTVKVNGMALSSWDYSAVYADNTEIGTATVTITGQGPLYSGSLTASFRIKKNLFLASKGMSLTIFEKEDAIGLNDYFYVPVDLEASGIQVRTRLGEESWSEVFAPELTDETERISINGSEEESRVCRISVLLAPSQMSEKLQILIEIPDADGTVSARMHSFLSGSLYMEDCYERSAELLEEKEELEAEYGSLEAALEAGVITQAELEEIADAKRNRTVLISLANYCAAVQTYFGYGDDSLANASLEEEDRTLPDLSSLDLDAYEFICPELPDGLRYCGSSLILESAASICHYFTLEEGTEISAFNFTCEGETLAPVSEDGELWKVEIPQISPGNYSSPVILTITEGDLSAELTYSVFHYLKKAQEQGTEDALTNLLAAMYVYGLTCEEY